jgi:hypothetical protein
MNHPKPAIKLFGMGSEHSFAANLPVENHQSIVTNIERGKNFANGNWKPNEKHILIHSVREGCIWFGTAEIDPNLTR